MYQFVGKLVLLCKDCCWSVISGVACHEAMEEPCHDMLCNAMPGHAVAGHAMPCHARPCRVMLCHAVPCRAVLYHVVPLELLTSGGESGG